MLKKILISLLSLFIALPFCAVAEDEVPPGVSLKDSDMKAFIKNYDKIDKDLEKLNCEVNQVSSYESDAEKVAAFENVLLKNGMSGPSAFAKLMIIYTDFTIEEYDRALNSDALTRALFKKMYSGGEPFAEMRDSLNPDDYQLVKKYYSPLCKVFNAQEFGEVKKTAKKPSSDEEKDDGSWTDEDTEDVKKAVKEAAKEAVKEEIKEQAKQDFKNALKKGGRSLLPF